MSAGPPVALDVDGIRLPLSQTVLGPELEQQDGPLLAFAVVVASALRNDVDGLVEALLEGRPFGGKGMSVDPGHEIDAAPATLFELDFRPAHSLVADHVVRTLVEQLVELRARDGAPAPWLFRPDPLWPSAHPDERAVLEDLESRAVTLDDAGATDDILTRQVLLRDLDAVGLLSPVQRGPKSHVLMRWGLPHLVAWYDAAAAAAAYLESSGRRRYVPDAAAEPVLGSPVSIDLFRGGLVVPATVDADEWTSWGEALLGIAPRPGNGGQYLHHDADGWVTVRWRRDHPARPSLVGLELGDPWRPPPPPG